MTQINYNAIKYLLLVALATVTMAVQGCVASNNKCVTEGLGEIALVKTKVFQLNYISVTELEAELNDALGAEGCPLLSPQTLLEFNPRVNRVTVTGSALQLEVIANFIKEWDLPLPHIILEMKIIEAPADWLEERLIFNESNLKAEELVLLPHKEGRLSRLLGQKKRVFVIPSSQTKYLEQKLQALDEIDGARMVAAPSLTIVDNGEGAKIERGGDYCCFCSDEVRESLHQEFLRDVSTYRVIPYLQADGHIRLEIFIYLNMFVTDSYPHASFNKLESEAYFDVTLEDGDTLLITGLCRLSVERQKELREQAPVSEADAIIVNDSECQPTYILLQPRLVQMWPVRARR